MQNTHTQTLAFLLPSIHRLLEADATVFRPGRHIGLLVLAPTRELAAQIAQQAAALVLHDRGWTVRTVSGGASLSRDRAAVLHNAPPTILVATPGRLLDLLTTATTTTTTRVQGGNRRFADVIGETPIVVLDEADRLLEAFPREMSQILSFLPRVEKRQTLLFSATFPAKLIAGLLSSSSQEGRRNNILPADFVRVDCVADDNVSTQTNRRVEQSYVQLVDMKSYLTGLLSIVEHAMKDDDSDSHGTSSKIVVFFPTAKLVKFVAEAMMLLSPKLPVLSIHSRMGQGARNRASSQFRLAKRSILLTSDVSARGVDYPDVSLVVQVRSDRPTLLRTTVLFLDLVHIPALSTYGPLRLRMLLFSLTRVLTLACFNGVSLFVLTSSTELPTITNCTYTA